MHDNQCNQMQSNAINAISGFKCNQLISATYIQTHLHYLYWESPSENNTFTLHNALSILGIAFLRFKIRIKVRVTLGTGARVRVRIRVRVRVGARVRVRARGLGLEG